MAKLLVIDNYDSFTYNLVQMFMDYELQIVVKRADNISVEEAASLKPDYILISPGPKDPVHSGISIPVIEHFYREVPLLGVCLGMQCINEKFGGETVRAPVPVHGKTSMVIHKGEGILSDIPLNFMAARYHSLMIRPAKSPMIITAMSDDNVIMGISHPEYPLHGVQFHPESFLTEYGHIMVKNFLSLGPLHLKFKGF